jgi:hypothetical protein
MSAPLPDFQFIIAAASAAMQAIQTWLAFRDRKRAAKTYDVALSSALSDVTTAEESHLLTTVVPLHILISLAGRTDNCFNRYSEILKSDQEYLPSEVDDATLALKRCVCRELRRIYELNGSIPPGKLREWWNLYRCAEV